MARRTRTLRRRALAALAILLWIAGVEVLPNVHLAAHDDDHTHAPDGTIVRVVFEQPHRHDDGTVHAHGGGDAGGDVADHGAAKRKRGSARLAIDEAPAHHAAAGLAHRAVALH